MHKPFHQQPQGGGHFPFWGSRKTLLYSLSPVEIFFFRIRAIFSEFHIRRKKRRGHSLDLVYLKKMMVLDLQYILVSLCTKTGSFQFNFVIYICYNYLIFHISSFLIKVIWELNWFLFLNIKACQNKRNKRRNQKQCLFKEMHLKK